MIGSMFRNIQIIALLMNKIQQGWLISTIVVLAPILQSLSLTSVVKLLAIPGSAIENQIAIAICALFLSFSTQGQIVPVGELATVYSRCDEAFQMLKTE